MSTTLATDASRRRHGNEESADRLDVLLVAARADGDWAASWVRRCVRRTARVHLRELNRASCHSRAFARHVSDAAPEVVVVTIPGGLAQGAWLKSLGWRVVAVCAPGTLRRRPRRLLARLLDAVVDVDDRSAPELAADRLAATLAAAAGRPGAGLVGGPPISVVTSVLNEKHNIAALVEAVGKQLRSDDEYVLVDGGSADGTVAYVRAAAARDRRIRLLSAPGTNISAARNVGVRAAGHEHIACTDAGCTPVPGWLQALRIPFAEEEPPGLVAGNAGVRARTARELAQALSCYPDPAESRRPDLAARLYGKLFGLTFDPTLPFARSIAFSRQAWRDAGGFAEDIRWTEDGVFGRAVARSHTCVFAADAQVAWEQHASLRATARMYVRYGQGAAESGDSQLQLRDAIRVAAYAGAVGMLLNGGWRAFSLVLTASGAYLSLPLRRILRLRAGWRTLAWVPLAMATKDLGKITGAASTHLSARRRRS